MYNVGAVTETILDTVKQSERLRLLALALNEAAAMGLEVTGELHDALEEAISSQHPSLRFS